MASVINAGTTTATALNITTDTTGSLNIQTSGTNAIAISNAQVVSLTNPLLPASGGTGITSLGTGVATFLGTPSSANLLAAVTDETGTGSLVFSASPAFTGTPTAPTAAVSTDTTQIATTAFVRDIIPTGIISMWSGSIASIPSGWLICDGTSGTPDLRNRFIVGAGSTYAVAATGGSADAVVVSHTHTATSSSSVSDPGHDHEVFPKLAGSFAGGGSFIQGATSASSYGGNNTGVRTTGISVSTSTTVNSAGVSGTNANLPPYYALAYIMKS
jgi:hypothetical protein